MQNMVMLSILAQQDGEGLDELNKVARFQMLGLGMAGIEAQTEEEEQYVAMIEQQKGSARAAARPRLYDCTDARADAPNASTAKA